MPIGPQDHASNPIRESQPKRFQKDTVNEPLSLLTFTVLLLGLLSHRLFAEDLTGRHKTESTLVRRSARLQ